MRPIRRQPTPDAPGSRVGDPGGADGCNCLSLKIGGGDVGTPGSRPGSRFVAATLYLHADYRRLSPKAVPMSESTPLDEFRRLAAEVARENGEMEDDLLALKEAVTIRILLDALYGLGRRSGAADALSE